MGPEKSSVISLKNFQFLTPHLPKLEGDLQSLLYEIDQLIEKKKDSWKNDLTSSSNQKTDNVYTNELIKPEKSTANHFRATDELDQNCSGEQLIQMKGTVEWMRRNYESLKNAYDKQISVEKEKSRKALQKFEQDNRILLSELKSLRETNRTKTEVLASQLSEEKTVTARLQERCNELEQRLNSCITALEQEREAQRNLQSTMQSRQSELDTVLRKTSGTVESQAKELSQVKRTLEMKEIELAELASALSDREADLVASKRIVHRLEASVSKHLSLLSTQKCSESPPPSPPPVAPNGVQISDAAVETDGLDGKLSKLERSIRVAQRSLKSKIHEFSRLKAACNVASTTIRKLNASKTESERQVSSVRQSLLGVLHTSQCAFQSMESLQAILFSKVAEAEGRVQQLAQSLQELQRRRLENKPTRAQCSTAVQYQDAWASSNVTVSAQTEEEFTVPSDYWPGVKVQMLRNDWLLTVQRLQRTIDDLTEERTELIGKLKFESQRVDELQRDNLALTDLLTDAEQFNRTRTPCETASITRDSAVQTTPQHEHVTSLESPSSSDVIAHLNQVEKSSPQVKHPSVALTSTPAVMCASTPPLLSRDIDPVPVERTEGSPISNMSTFSLSPVEFGDFVLSDNNPSRRPHSVTCTPHSPSPSTFDYSAAVRSQTPTLRLSGDRSSERRKEHVRFDSKPQVHHLDFVNSARVNSDLPPLAHRTCPNDTSCGPFRNAPEGDRDMHAFAAKFLADEQQHSLRLEQQINMHLEELKRQIGL